MAMHTWGWCTTKPHTEKDTQKKKKSRIKI